MTTAMKTPVSALATTPSSRNNQHEISTSYNRTDGKRVEMVMMKQWACGPTELLIGAYRTQDNPNCNTSQYVALSIEEARILRDLLNREDVQALLNAQ